MVIDPIVASKFPKVPFGYREDALYKVFVSRAFPFLLALNFSVEVPSLIYSQSHPMANLQDPGRLSAASSQAPGHHLLTPEAAYTYKSTTAANSSRSSIFDSTMEKDLEQGVHLPAGEATGDSSSGHDEPPNAEKNIEEGREGNVAAPQGLNPMDPSQFPEGGLEAWTVVFGAACGIYVSFGWINCASACPPLKCLVLQMLTSLFGQALVSFRNIISRTSSGIILHKRLPGSLL